MDHVQLHYPTHTGVTWSPGKHEAGNVATALASQGYPAPTDHTAGYQLVSHVDPAVSSHPYTPRYVLCLRASCLFETRIILRLSISSEMYLDLEA